jgi:hypothetical protein
MRVGSHDADNKSGVAVIRGLILAAALLVAHSTAHAASLDGVSMPDSREVNGVRTQLNGIGLRTFSLLGIRVYIAGLYLEHRSSNPDEILRSPGIKLVDMRFLRDVDAEDARKAWREGFERNCKAPCHLDRYDMQQFLRAIPTVREGDECSFLFTSRGVHVSLNKVPVGDIPDPRFAELILGTFIGAVPPTPRLKRELLGLRD